MRQRKACLYRISIYDGTYFTESAPLVFKSSAPVTSGDVFKGVWEKSATLNTVCPELRLPRRLQVLYRNRQGLFVLHRTARAKFLSYNCYLVDNYNGVWVGEESIDGVSFEILDFNGMGIYNTDGSDGSAPKGPFRL